jgi:hypothetical protein
MIRVILLVLLLVPAWGFAQESEETKQPSLAELARRERERRAQLKEVPVITNAHLGRAAGGLVSTAAGSGAESGAAEGEEGAEAEAADSENAEPETDWAGEFGEARLNLKNAVNRDLVLQLKMNDLRNEYLSGSQNKGKVQQQLLETQQEIEKNSQDVQTARKAIDSLQGDAKEKGVPDDQINGMVGELPKDTSITRRPDQ